MLDKFESENYTDINGNPAGGYAKGTGIDILWQNSPLGRGEELIEPDGAFVETVIQIVIDRLQFYQSGKFSCQENAIAIIKLQEALHWLNHRTTDREKRSVEGTHII